MLMPLWCTHFSLCSINIWLIIPRMIQSTMVFPAIAMTKMTENPRVHNIWSRLQAESPVCLENEENGESGCVCLSLCQNNSENAICWLLTTQETDVHPTRMKIKQNNTNFKHNKESKSNQAKIFIKVWQSYKTYWLESNPEQLDKFSILLLMILIWCAEY